MPSKTDLSPVLVSSEKNLVSEAVAPIVIKGVCVGFIESFSPSVCQKVDRLCEHTDGCVVSFPVFIVSGGK